MAPGAQSCAPPVGRGAAAASPADVVGCAEVSDGTSEIEGDGCTLASSAWGAGVGSPEGEEHAVSAATASSAAVARAGRAFMAPA